ncbi:hypothetical protein KKA14_08065 [bacterium]|nr:hypothetical protein [bacterium]
MIPKELFEIIKMLEKDLAKFYEKLRKVTQLNEFVEVFELMSKHSSAHSNSIESKFENIKIPELEVESVYKVHSQIKKSLFEKVTSEHDVNKALALLANSEELIGKLYSSIAENYHKTANAYQSASNQLKQLAEDEQKHRDFILNKISDLK